MKKIKVLVPNSIIMLLEADKAYVKKSMNRIHNNIVEYYLENGLDIEKDDKKNDAQIQFYLYEHILDRYFKSMRENGYDNESDFLRDIYYEYSKEAKENRIEILKKVKEKK